MEGCLNWLVIFLQNNTTRSLFLILSFPFSASMTIFFDFCLIFCVRVLCSTIGVSSTLSIVILREMFSDFFSEDLENLTRNCKRYKQPHKATKVFVGFSNDEKKSHNARTPLAMSAITILFRIIWKDFSKYVENILKVSNLLKLFQR